MFLNYIHRIDGATVNEVLIHNLAFTEVGGDNPYQAHIQGARDSPPPPPFDA